MAVRLGADATSTSISALRSLGATFVCRYLSPPQNTWKNLTLAEANALKGAGLDIVSNWEYGTNDYQGGYSQGVNYAQQAEAMHLACGGPPAAPIYFSVDTDVSGASAASYFQGINSVLGVGRTGVYGSTGMCTYLRGAGLVSYTWRTMSTDWSGGAGVSADFNIEQTGYFNSSYDRDASITDNFGQWSAFSGGAPAPGPTPTPVPVGSSYQERASHNTLTPLTVDGYFGMHSWAALQFVLGVTTDGNPGPATYTALQAMLVKRGSNVLVQDGVLGGQTIGALQEKIGVSQTLNWGTVTSTQTQKALNGGTLWGAN